MLACEPEDGFFGNNIAVAPPKLGFLKYFSALQP